MRGLASETRTSKGRRFNKTKRSLTRKECLRHWQWQCEFAYADDRQLEQHRDFIGLLGSCFRYMDSCIHHAVCKYQGKEKKV